MSHALRLVVFLLYPLQLANVYFWWPVSILGCIVAIAMMAIAPKLLGD